MKNIESPRNIENQSIVGLEIDAAFWILWSHVEANLQEVGEVVGGSLELAQCVHRNQEDFRLFCIKNIET